MLEIITVISWSWWFDRLEYKHTRIVCSLFAKQVLKGSRLNTHLNFVGYEEVVEDFFQRTGIWPSKR
jgi:hypothetical protein